MTFKTLSKKQNGTVDPSPFSLQKFMRWLKVGYYRNVLLQLMCKICLTGFAHCAIVVKQWCWNRTNWKRQNLFNSNVLSTICQGKFKNHYWMVLNKVQKWSNHLLMVLCLRTSLVVSTILLHGPSWSHSSWNNDVGIGPIGKDRTFSTVTSSRQFARTSARRKTTSVLIWT
jgi:hypothetical protein